MAIIRSINSNVGDQPIAIETLSQGIQKGERYVTLDGVTGSGKTYTMAKVIEWVM